MVMIGCLTRRAPVRKGGLSVLACTVMHFKSLNLPYLNFISFASTVVYFFNISERTIDSAQGVTYLT